MTDTATHTAAGPQLHTTVHTATVSAPPSTVYRIIADAASWPHVFGPTVHAEAEALPNTASVPAGESAHEERLTLWAFANDQIRTWTSRRLLDPERLRVEFRQEVSSAPVASMSGRWHLGLLPDGGTRVVLEHDFSTVGDDAADTEWILRAVNHNSEAELAALKRAAELGEQFDRLTLTFTDSVLIHAPAGAVHDFLRRADLWAERLPHVAAMEFSEPADGLQRMKMQTRSPDGALHTTESVRVCLPDLSIVYKQIDMPEIMAAHTGRWTVRPSGGGVEATSQHTVVIRPEKIAAALGPDATVDEARAKIRAALGANSLATLNLAKAAAEGSVWASGGASSGTPAGASVGTAAGTGK